MVRLNDLKEVGSLNRVGRLSELGRGHVEGSLFRITLPIVRVELEKEGSEVADWSRHQVKVLDRGPS